MKQEQNYVEIPTVGQKSIRCFLNTKRFEMNYGKHTFSLLCQLSSQRFITSVFLEHSLQKFIHCGLKHEENFLQAPLTLSSIA